MLTTLVGQIMRDAQLQWDAAHSLCEEREVVSKVGDGEREMDENKVDERGNDERRWIMDGV